MKKTKKILAAVLALAMALSLGVTAFAEPAYYEGNQDAPAAETHLSYTVEEAYEWAVPATIEFVDVDGGLVKTGDVNVTKNIIASDKVLKINIAAGEDFKIKDANGHELAYTVACATKGTANSGAWTVAASPLAAGGTCLNVMNGTNTGSITLTFTLTPDGVQRAGTYEGICNFASEVVAAN